MKSACLLCGTSAAPPVPFCPDCYKSRMSAFGYICAEPGTVPEPSEIEPGLLYLSTGASARNREILEKLGVRAILTVADITPLFPLDFEYKVEDRNDADLGKHFDEMCDFVAAAHASGKPVLVHCGAGQSRSPTAVMAYLIRSRKWTLKQAYDHVAKIRPFIYPNEVFVRQLREFEQRCLAKK